MTPACESRGSILCRTSFRFCTRACAILLAFAPCLMAQNLSPPLQHAKRLAPHVRAHEFLRGRTLRGVDLSPAAALDRARRQHRSLLARSRAQDLTTAWTAVGPAAVTNPVYGSVTGRVTAVAFDPADSTGNTVYVGTTGGGVWKSPNAAGPASNVTFAPLTDTLPVFDLSAGSSATPSLSIGALAVAGGIVLAGTGDPNDATDSYYGGGILRSADGGLTWTLAKGSNDGVYGHHSFVGLSVSGLAFSTTNSQLAVAALSSSAEGAAVNAGSLTDAVPGLYVSQDAGMTWTMASLSDGYGKVQAAATSVVWNAARQMFFAAIQNHGYFASSDGMNWSKLAKQPGAGITQVACPTITTSLTCPVFRGTLAVQPITGDMFALTVDASNHDQGLFQDLCAIDAHGSCGNATVQWATQLKSAPLEVGSGSSEIPQADYDLVLAAAPSGTDTLLYAGTIDLYRCSLAGGCILRNTTNAENGCQTPAGVASAQHAIATFPLATSGPLVFLGNDGGVWRSIDGVAESGGVCSSGDASHFDNLNAGIGSLTEVVSFAQDPISPTTLLAGLGALGTAGTGTDSGAWEPMATGEGGTVAIDPVNALNWYLSDGPGVTIANCTAGAQCGMVDFTKTAIGATQVDGDQAAVHAPWLLDPQATGEMLVGTCRVWRGPSTGGSAWLDTDLLSAPFAASSATGCDPSDAPVRSVSTGGGLNVTGSAPNFGTTVVYAGMAGDFPFGLGVAGHLFATEAADKASRTTAWTDLALSPVTNTESEGAGFNPGQFDVSSVVADAHDPTGATVYATVMGFAGNGIDAAHVYRSTDGGASWTNISSNLPNAPANSLIVDPNDANTVYIALDTGVYATRSIATCASADCWDVYGTGLPNAPVTELAAATGMSTGDGRTGELRASTYGRGIWQIPLLTAVAPAVPAITLSSTAVTFPNQQAGTQSPSVTLTVTNSGNATLTVTSVTTTGDFAEAENCVGSPLAPSATCSVSVQFVPTGTGTRNGVLTVYGNVAGGQATATLTGVGTGAASVVLTPIAMSFASTPVGATTSAQNVTVSNTGGNSSNLQSITVNGDFTITANSCGSSLAPQTGCTISMEFAPTASGQRSGTLTVVDDVGTQVATLSGIGISPATDALAPLSLSFPPQELGTASTPQQVRLTNTGGAALTLIAPLVTGDFSVVNGCGASLTGGSSCSLQVSYVPKSLGAETGVLTVSDVIRSQTVALSGTGVAPPGVSLSPSGGLIFSATPVGQQAPAQTITLTNNGGLPLTMDGVAATGDFSVGSNTCGRTVGAGGTCVVQILYVPTAAGVRTGTVTLIDSAGSSPQTIPLSGIGVDFSLAIDGPVSQTIASGQSATYLLLLSSATGVPGSAALACTGAPAQAICTVNPATAVLGDANGTVLTVTLATGQATASLQPLTGRPNSAIFWFALSLPAGLCLGRRRWRGLMLILCLTLIGCGTVDRTIPGTGTGGGGGTGPIITTPSGTYTLVVSGASDGLVRSVNLTVVVQ